MSSKIKLKSLLKITSYTATSGVGTGVAAHRSALTESRTGLKKCDFPGIDLDTWIGRVDGLDNYKIKQSLLDFDCRNNRLIQLGLEQDQFSDSIEQAKQKYGANRMGIFIGTSTSGIEQTEQLYQQRGSLDAKLSDQFNYQKTQNIYSAADFMRRLLDISGPAQVISTACSSSAKVFATAQRYIKAGLCDAAIVGGADSLCQMTLYGFNSLQLVSQDVCRPADAKRDGINIGEACGFALLEWSEDDLDMRLLGVGESSDAYHLSTPHPQGKGAALSMSRALASSGLKASDIDYINLHGTATPVNDASEDRAVMSVFGDKTDCSSTKGFTGHTLGAAGIIEAVFSMLAIEENIVPMSLNTQQIDPNIHSAIALQPIHKPVNRVISNSFGFGGTNASLIFGRQI